MSTNETKNPKEIEAQVTIEITETAEKGEKQKKPTNIWASIALWAFIAIIVSLFVSGIAVVISTVVFFFAIAMAIFYGHHRFTDDSIIYCDSPLFPDSTDSDNT